MSKVLIGIIAVMTIIGYFLWNENSRLSALNQAKQQYLAVLAEKHTECLLTRMYA